MKPKGSIVQSLLAAGLMLMPGLAFAGEEGIASKIDAMFGTVVGIIASVFFFEIPFIGMPFVVFWLFAGAIFFTVRMGFVNVRFFAHAIQVVRGKYDDPEDEGEVSHFQALTSALSATVGLGNIAGVAIAVGLGGPGATFWMIMAGLFGMSSKFVECTLGQRYRVVRNDGTIGGGPMYYLSEGLKKRGQTGLGKVLGVSFAVLCIGGSLGGGTAFQVSQSMGVVREVFPALRGFEWLYGLIMMILVGIVIIGGIKRIAAIAEKIVPLMCGVYVLACLYILGVHADLIPTAFGAIFASAFGADSLFGGFVGVLVTGITRAAFSNEAGIGSAAIAHSAAKTAYSVREGIVALLEPFIDTVVICTMTALVIVISGAYGPDHAVYGEIIRTKQGAALTSAAMGETLTFFPYILMVAVVLFAYSTMISWSYYGERCWTWLFGERSSMIYRVIFLIVVFLGSILTAGAVLDLSDLMILSMSLPNILGLYFLHGEVKKELDDYTKGLKDGSIKPYDG